jgi:hypothetical protein
MTGQAAAINLNMSLLTTFPAKNKPLDSCARRQKRCASSNCISVIEIIGAHGEITMRKDDRNYVLFSSNSMCFEIHWVNTGVTNVQRQQKICVSSSCEFLRPVICRNGVQDDRNYVFL